MLCSLAVVSLDALLSRTVDGKHVQEKDIEDLEQDACSACDDIVRTVGEDREKILQLVEGRSISIASIVRHHSLRIYLLCHTKHDLECLRALFDSCQLPGIFTLKLKELIGARRCPRVNVAAVQYVSLVDYCGCFDYFAAGTCMLLYNGT